MSYKKKTQFYRIPVMGDGDILTEDQEWVQMSTIDNLLRAATFGCKNAYLEEGEFTIKYDKAGSRYILYIDPYEGKDYSLLGMINGRLFMSTETIEVKSLQKDTTYYVYVEYLDGLETDANYFSVNAYTTEQETGDTRMPLCIVENLEVNTNFGDKVYGANILSHTMDSTNPHGSTLVQDNLNVKTSIRLNDKDVVGVEYKESVTAGNSDCTTVEFSLNPLFITVYPTSGGAGEIWWEISGNTAKIYNSGSAGITMKIKADVK